MLKKRFLCMQNVYFRKKLQKLPGFEHWLIDSVVVWKFLYWLSSKLIIFIKWKFYFILLIHALKYMHSKTQTRLCYTGSFYFSASITRTVRYIVFLVITWALSSVFQNEPVGGKEMLPKVSPPEATFYTEQVLHRV